MQHITLDTVLRVVAIALMLAAAVILVACGGTHAAFPLERTGIRMIEILRGAGRRHGPAN